MISHQHKCIFIHIPKTAGTSVENLIWPEIDQRTADDLWMGFTNDFGNQYQTGGLQHLKASQIREVVGEEIFNSYYKFSVVRNPWDKCISQFVYTKQKNKSLRKYLGVNRFTSLKKYLRLIEKKEHVQWMKQVDFLYDDEGNCLVDKIIKYENINREFGEVLSELGLPEMKLPHENKSRRKHYSQYFDSVTKEMVREIYQADISTFDYEY